MATKLLSSIKNHFLSHDTMSRRILGGVNRGLFYDLSLQSDSQTWLGISERELMPWFLSLAKGIETAIDVGAANGFYSLFFLHKTSAQKVYAYEPDAECQGRFFRNLAINPKSEKLVFSSKLVGQTSDETYSTLDSLMPITTPCLIKVDVEGAEMDVLNGASVLAAQPGVRWIIETHSLALEKECKAWLESRGYQTRIIPRAWWRTLLPELRPAEYNGWLVAYR